MIPNTVEEDMNCTSSSYTLVRENRFQNDLMFGDIMSGCFQKLVKLGLESENIAIFCETGSATDLLVSNCPVIKQFRVRKAAFYAKW